MNGRRVHLGARCLPGFLQEERTELDESQGGLAPGDDGVHTGTVGVVGADTAVAVAIKGSGVTTGPTVAFAGNEIDKRGLGLLHALPFGTRARVPQSVTVTGRPFAAARWDCASISTQLSDAKREIVENGRQDRANRETMPRQTGGRGQSGRLLELVGRCAAEHEVVGQGGKLVGISTSPKPRVLVDRAPRSG